MTRGESNYHKNLRDNSKRIILEHIQKNSATYVNAIVKALSMSKNTVSRNVSELLEEKQIIYLLDSKNKNYNNITPKKYRNELVYYDQTGEELGKTFNFKDEKPIDVPFNYLRTPEYFQIQKNIRISFQKTKASLKEVIGLYKTFNEHDKKILLPSLQKTLNYYYQLKLELKKQDHRVKYTEWEKILVAYSISGRFTIGQFTKLENKPYKEKEKKFISKKYISKLSKQYPVSKDDPRYPEFKKRVGCCSNCGHSVADGLLEKIKQL